MHYARFKNSSEKIAVGKIVCVGRNYAEHAQELGNEVPPKPVVFIKPSSSILHDGGSIIHPDFSSEMHHEVELVLLIGHTIKEADYNTAGDAITAYGVGLDMTLRDVQGELKKKGHPWTIAKCFDTSAVISDFTKKEDKALTLEEEISLKVNDHFRQRDKLNKMIFKPAQIVEYLSTLFTLEEGDLVFTGTPAGVGMVKRGDRLAAEIEGIGHLTVSVK